MFAYDMDPTAVAEWLDTTSQTISRWKKAKRSPTGPTLTGIASKFGVSDVDLTGKDLTLYFIFRSGLIETNLAMESDGIYGIAVLKENIKKQVESMRDRLKSLVDDAEGVLQYVK